MTTEAPPAVKLQNISKSFPGVQALEDVSFEIAPGACHALLGENGAGKSTLGKILAGVVVPDSGTIHLHGQPVAFRSPNEAAQGGVAIVHQELLFCPNLSVAENLCLHDLPTGRFGIDRAAMNERAKKLLAEVGLDVDVTRPVSSLSIAQEQLVQIASAVGFDARVVVFDEPTSSLGPSEVERLFALIRRLQARGTTIIYVSHRLDEIFALCQSVTVLRDGRHVATKPVSEVSRDDLVRLMVGRSVQFQEPPPRDVAQAPVRLEVVGLSSPGKFTDIHFSVRAGEIVGLAGLVGAGRTEIVEAIFGLDHHATGVVKLDGAVQRIRSPRAASRLGLGLVPEDRKQCGLVLPMNVRQNSSMAVIERLRTFIGIDRRAERELADQTVARLRVRTSSIEKPVVQLSGGNQQKIVLGKWLAAGGRVLLVDEPTRGVDVGAKQEIHDLLGELAQNGVAIVVISSEMPELLALSDRLIVIREGILAAEFSRGTPAETVLRAMAGVTEDAHSA